MQSSSSDDISISGPLTIFIISGYTEKNFNLVHSFELFWQVILNFFFIKNDYNFDDIKDIGYSMFP